MEGNNENMKKRCAEPLTVFGSSGKGAYNCILASQEHTKEMIKTAMGLLTKSAEEIENLYGRETNLTTEIRGFLEKYE